VLPPALSAAHAPACPSFPPRRSSDLLGDLPNRGAVLGLAAHRLRLGHRAAPGGFAGLRRYREHHLHDIEDLVLLAAAGPAGAARSEEHTSELQSLAYLVCRPLLEKKK